MHHFFHKFTDKISNKPPFSFLFAELKRIDLLCMSALILIFTFLSFFRLGNPYAPETFYSTTEKETDIVLDFGDYIDISKISIYLGNLNTRHFSISAFNEVTGSWEVINGEAAAESVFSWNSIDINYNLRYLGLVSTDEEAVLNELVVTNPQGQIVTPVNASDYPSLFDEQELFPAYKTYMSGTMFDEVYHGRTAYEFIHGLTTYETTHPPLGKSIISIGILLFGMNPFGFRFMSVIFGILMIPLMYLFAKKLFNSTFSAAFASALITFDFMHYTLSRIATIDIFAAFFILLMYYFMYCYFDRERSLRLTGSFVNDQKLPVRLLIPLGLGGISMALSIATKWTGVYAGIGLGFLFISYTLMHFPKYYKKLFIFCTIFFVAIPLAVYVLSFIPVVGSAPFNGLIDKTIKNTQYMFNYHAHLNAEHYYSSPYYEWPVIWMPLLYANDAADAVRISSVSCMGNPVIWWMGIPCILFTLYRLTFKRDKKAGFLLIAYAAQYVPWMLVKRITFIYHYFPAVLFVMLMMGYTVKHLTEHFKWGKKATGAYLAVAVICFILFFPVISGLPVVKEWGFHLRWLRDWILVL